MRPLKIASRGSKLALVQSNYIFNLLKNLSSNIEISIVEISTKGDRDKSDFLYKTDSMGFSLLKLKMPFLTAGLILPFIVLRTCPRPAQKDS